MGKYDDLLAIAGESTTATAEPKRSKYADLQEIAGMSDTPSAPPAPAPKPTAQPPQPAKPGKVKTFYNDYINPAVEPIVQAGKDFVSGVQRAGEAGGKRYAEAGNPLTKTLAGLSTAVDAAGQVGYAPINAVMREAKNAAAPLPKMAWITPEIDKKIGEGAATAYGAVSDKVKNAPGWLKSLGIIGANAPMLPLAKGVGVSAVKGTEKVVEGVGKGTISKGKDFLASDLKIKQNLAKKGYGKTIDEKKQNIVNDIVNFGLESSTGNFEKTAKKAYEMATDRFRQVDDIVNELSTRQNPPMANAVEVAKNGLDSKTIAAYGKRDQAKAIVDGITKDMAADGLDGNVTLNRLIEAKRNLDPDGRLFTNGPAVSEADALERMIRKKMYLNLVDKVANISEETKRLNTEAKKLLDIHAVATDASSRIRNNNQISLTDWIVGAAGGAASLSNPGALAITAGTVGLKKSFAQGRGAGVLIKTGKALESAATKDIIPERFQRKPKGTPDIYGPTPPPERLALPAPIIGGEQQVKPMLPTVAERIRSIGTNPPKPTERLALPAPMIGGKQKIEPMLPSMLDRLKSIGNGPQKTFDVPGTSGVQKAEPLALDLQKAASEILTQPQLKAAVRNALETQALPQADRSALIDALRTLNRGEPAEWPKRIDKYRNKR